MLDFDVSFNTWKTEFWLLLLQRLDSKNAETVNPKDVKNVTLREKLENHSTLQLCPMMYLS